MDAVHAAEDAATSIIAELCVAQTIFERQLRDEAGAARDKTQKQVNAIREMAARADACLCGVDAVVQRARSVGAREERLRQQERTRAAERTLEQLGSMGVPIDEFEAEWDARGGERGVSRDEWDEWEREEEEEQVIAESSREIPRRAEISQNMVSTFGTNWTREGDVLRVHTTSAGHDLVMSDTTDSQIFINPALVGETRSSFAWSWQRRSENTERPIPRQTLANVIPIQKSSFTDEIETVWEEDDT